MPKNKKKCKHKSVQSWGDSVVCYECGKKVM